MKERVSRGVSLGQNLSRDCLLIRRTKTSRQDALDFAPDQTLYLTLALSGVLFPRKEEG